MSEPQNSSKIDYITSEVHLKHVYFSKFSISDGTSCSKKKKKNKHKATTYILKFH